MSETFGIDGRKLKRLRKENHWSQEELAKKAGLDQSLISRFERGKQTNTHTETLAQLAAALGVSIKDLLPCVEAEEPVPVASGIMKELAGVSTDKLKRALWIADLPEDYLRELERLGKLIKKDRSELNKQ